MSTESQREKEKQIQRYGSDRGNDNSTNGKTKRNVELTLSKEKQELSWGCVKFEVCGLSHRTCLPSYYAPLTH